jgi:hypothetical protein
LNRELGKPCCSSDVRGAGIGRRSSLLPKPENFKGGKKMKVRDLQQLKMSLKLYKEALGPERLKVREEKRLPVEVGQIRVLLWMPNEYVLVFKVEDDGLVHAVPLTVWVNLTTCSLRLHVRHYTWAPLPFVVYLRKELLEQESYPIAIVRQETIEKVLRDVERSPTWSAWRPVREFLNLVWKRYEELTLGSLFYTHDLREKGEV